MPKEGGTIITLGGWYQRTTLHLTEIYEFFSKGNSRLALSEDKLKELYNNLNFKSVTRETGDLDYVKAITKTGIELRYYEDGLYILEITSNDIDKSVNLLKDYFDRVFNPTINFIFSLGAPTPKILSNIQDEHPIVVTQVNNNHSQFKVLSKFGEVYAKTTSKDVSVYRTSGYIFIVGNSDNLESIVEMQIFFREFKDQLHKYLNIHRKIWEEISEIKEKKFIKGQEVEFYRAKLEGYKKTIDLISSRINQMPSYAKTREALARDLNIEKSLVNLFQYKFEDLFNTLAYIKEIWSMTQNYINSAISILVEVANKANTSGIRSIQVLASIGVFTVLIGYLSKDTFPTFSKIGVYYFLFLIIGVLVIEFIIKRYAQIKKYELKFTEREKNI